MDNNQQIVNALLGIKAVGFLPDNPITFKSGILSPVYVDNRRFPYFPTKWQSIISGFQQLVQEENLEFDVIAGIETAGIPHSAALGYRLQVPSVFVRKKIKNHGTKSRVEGGDVENKRVLLLEDHITTGGSSLSGVAALRNEGAIVTDCIAITSYEFEEARVAFSAANVQLHTLVGFAEILDTATKRKIITSAEKEEVESWLDDPYSWTENHRV